MAGSMLLLLLALQTTDTTARPIPSDSYADSAAANLVASARAARERNERLVTAYTAIAKQRIGVGIRALNRDRMLYRQELVARISWKRDTVSEVEVIGAREGIPIALKGDQIPEELDEQARSMVLNPAEDYLRLVGEDDDGIIYPLRAGGEHDYRFESGDTTTITLASGKRIRLLALRIIPRRSDWRLMSGTLWFDADTYGLVQAVFRPARPFEFKRDIEEEDREDVPGWVNPKAEVKYITLEYGLYENRWWMPRYMAIDATGTMGSWLGVPLRVERVYEDYEVEGGTPPPADSRFRPAGTVRRHEQDDRVVDPLERQRIADSLKEAMDTCVAEVVAEMKEKDADIRRPIARARQECWRRRRAKEGNLVVVTPPDSMSMLTSPQLGEPILQMGDLIDEEEVRSLASAIKELPTSRPWQPRLELPSGVAGVLLQHARYNRVEALSLGASATLDLGPMALRGTARIGLADLEPNGELSLIRPTPNGRFALTGYRRLAAANPDTRPFGPINSLYSLLAQRDDGEYYRALGVELSAQNTNAGWISGRLYFQQERPAEVETQASLPHLFNEENEFRPNIAADSAEQFGGLVTLRGTRAVSRAVSLGGEAQVEGAGGDFEYGKGAGTLRLFVTPNGPLAGGATFSAGTSTGTPSTQGRFYLGGSATLRGYDGGVMAGDAYWNARVELGNSFPAFRLIGFADAGWAGERPQFSHGRPLIGAGVGASVLDGLVRFDLARALRNPTGWRFEIYVDGVI